MKALCHQLVLSSRDGKIQQIWIFFLRLTNQQSSKTIKWSATQIFWKESTRRHLHQTSSNPLLLPKYFPILNFCYRLCCIMSKWPGTVKFLLADPYLNLQWSKLLEICQADSVIWPINLTVSSILSPFKVAQLNFWLFLVI